MRPIRNSRQAPQPRTSQAPVDQPQARRAGGDTRVTQRHLASRRAQLTVAAVLLVAVAGAAAAVAAGAFRDRTPVHQGLPNPTALPHPPAVPPGPAWVDSTRVSTAKGVFTFEVHAVITAPGTGSRDPQNPTKGLVTVPQMGGYYTLTNTGAEPYDLAEPVRLFAYWKVPRGFCARYDPYMVADLTANNIPVVQVGGGQELCPMAFGDSTLDTTPQTLQPHQPARLSILATDMALGQDYPLHVSKSDAAVVAKVTATAPAAWFASDEELSTSTDHSIATSGLTAP